MYVNIRGWLGLVIPLRPQSSVRALGSIVWCASIGSVGLNRLTNPFLSMKGLALVPLLMMVMTLQGFCLRQKRPPNLSALVRPFPLQSLCMVVRHLVLLFVARMKLPGLWWTIAGAYLEGWCETTENFGDEGNSA